MHSSSIVNGYPQYTDGSIENLREVLFTLLYAFYLDAVVVVIDFLFF